jgi:hypothetical protein
LHLTFHYQHSAIRITSGSLDLNVLAISDAFEGIAESSRKELQKQASLLAGLEADLDVIARVKIHVEFMSPTVRMAIEGGEKPRTLGDYVSTVKMKQVGETCLRTHGMHIFLRLSVDQIMKQRGSQTNYDHDSPNVSKSWLASLTARTQCGLPSPT